VVSIWFNKFANRSLPELDAPEVGVPDVEFGVEEFVEPPPDELMSRTIVKLSSVIVVPEPPFTPLDVDELGADPTP
jgi:hypothetical protein